MQVHGVDEQFGRLLAECFSHSLSREEFSKLEMPPGMSEASSWRMVNLIRRASGITLPSGVVINNSWRADWYAPSRRLQKLLTACTAAGVTNPHALDVLASPEGRHVKINLLATDCFIALKDAGCALPRRELAAAALGLEVPHSDQERLVRNFFQVALDSVGSGFRLATADDIARVYQRCIEGVRLPTAHPEADREPSSDALACIERIFDKTSELETLMGAIARLLAFLELRPLPFANMFIGRMAFSGLLHAQGLTVLSYLPVLDFLDSWQRGSFETPGYHPVGRLSAAAQIIEGARDWTRFFEETLAWLLDETRWLLRKFARMKLRRERLEELLGRDTTYTERQHDVLLEALVHDDAEFTFSGLMEHYNVVYSTAHADLVGLCDDGFLQARRQGKRLVFIAVPEIHDRLHAFLRRIDSSLYAQFFDEQGRLVVDSETRETPGRAGQEEGGASPWAKAEEDVRKFLPTAEPQRRMALLRGLKRRDDARSAEESADSKA